VVHIVTIGLYKVQTTQTNRNSKWSYKTMCRFTVPSSNEISEAVCYMRTDMTIWVALETCFLSVYSQQYTGSNQRGVSCRLTALFRFDEFQLTWCPVLQSESSKAVNYSSISPLTASCTHIAWKLNCVSTKHKTHSFMYPCVVRFERPNSIKCKQ
jgi:hypothetical protein